MWLPLLFIATHAAEAADPVPFGPFSHVWTAETDNWNGGLLLAPSGDLLVFNGSAILVLARDDGHVLKRGDACSAVSEDGVAWLGDRVALVCDDELRILTWPALTSTTRVKFPREVEVAAVGGGVVAVGEDDFRIETGEAPVSVRVYDGASGKLLDSFSSGGEIESIAVSPDGKTVAVGVEDLGIHIRDLATKTTLRTLPGEGSALRFSPDGTWLYGASKSFEVGLVRPATGETTGKWEVGSWLTAARWVDGTHVVATGSDGLAWFEQGKETLECPVDDLGEGIATSADGGTVCAGGRGGRISCFARTPPAPSDLAKTLAAPSRAATTPPATGTPAASPAPSSATPSAAPREGDLVSRSGTTLTVTMPSAGIAVGATGTLSRAFQQDLGFGLVSGWLGIARVTVTQVGSNTVTLRILEEQSTIVVNGRKVDHFTPGRVKLELGR